MYWCFLPDISRAKGVLVVQRGPWRWSHEIFPRIMPWFSFEGDARMKVWHKIVGGLIGIAFTPIVFVSEVEVVFRVPENTKVWMRWVDELSGLGITIADATW